ncbi:MAG: NAD-dependent epimerase/dehydratase family protein [Rhodanobacteraceae bacterium]
MADHILVIGAGGFVGSRLLQAFVERKQRVIAIGRRAFAAPDTDVETVIAGGRDPQDYLPHLQHCRAVVHVASASTPGSSAAQPLMELEENLRPIMALLQALQEDPAIPLLYVSSGGTLYEPKADVDADESAMVAPRSYHGAGKIAAEHFIAAWCRQFCASATIVRPSNLYGPGQAERTGFGIVPAAFGKILRGETLHVWGDGSAERDYLYIDDFTRLCIAVLEAAPVRGTRVLNACSGASISLNDLFGEIQRVTGRKLQRTYESACAVDMPRVEMQADRALELYGWTPDVALPEGLERTWQWFETTRC